MLLSLSFIAATDEHFKCAYRNLDLETNADFFCFPEKAINLGIVCECVHGWCKRQ